MRALSITVVAWLLAACSGGPPKKTCPDTCLGCCNERGLCQSGLMNDACGAAGAACAACPAGVACRRGGCEVFTDGGAFTCGANTCDGTVADVCANGQCFCGNDNACSAGSRCVGGQCTCDSAHCAGCCTNGTCVPPEAQSTFACGAGGNACADCSKLGGDLCLQGACTCGGQTLCGKGNSCSGACFCDPSVCPGCCDGDHCVLFEQQGPLKCGKGPSCQQCGTQADGCTDGSCSCGDGGACGDGYTCSGGRCVCDVNACGGCCAGDTCLTLANQSAQQCGRFSACSACPQGYACFSTGCVCQQNVLACGAMDLAVGADHACASTSFSMLGSVFCWGSNAHGQLGLDGGPDYAVPTLVLGHSGELAASDTFTCEAEDTVRCWGETPLGSFAAPTFVPALSGIIELSLGEVHGCARDVQGRVRCWGDDTHHQLGAADGGTALSPVLVPSITAQQVAAGRTHTCALDADGGVLCWGRFDVSGPTPYDAVAPTPVTGIPAASAIASGDGVTCAASDGGINCFGKTSATFAVDATQLCVGAGFGCAITRTKNLVCWGDNSAGQLGNPDAGSSSAQPVPVLGLNGVISRVSCGRTHACAVGDRQAVFCWGDGSHGKLGNGSTANAPLPVQVAN